MPPQNYYARPASPFRKLIPIAIIGGIIGIVIIAVLSLAERGKLAVTLTKLPEGVARARVIVSDAEGKAVSNREMKAGETVELSVTKGAYTVTATTTNEVSATSADAPGFLGTGKASLDVRPEVAATKIGSDGLGCDTQAQGKLFTYSCTASEPLYGMVPAGGIKLGSRVPLNNDINVSRTKPYRDGVLALTHILRTHDIDTITYYNGANPSLATVTVPFPVERAGITVDSENTSSARFVLDDNESHAIYVYKDTADTDPRKIEPKSVSGIKTPTWLHDLRGNDLLAYEGLGAPSETPPKGYKGGRITIFDASTGNVRTEVNVGDSFHATDVRLISSTRIAAINDAGLHLYDIKGGSLVPLRAPHDSGKVISFDVQDKNRVVYTTSTAVYQHDTASGTTHRLFSTPIVTIARLGRASGDAIIFSGAVSESGGKQKLHTYQLDPSRPATYPRMESILPYGSALPIKAMDYYRDEVVISLVLTTFRVDSNTRRPTYSQAEYDTNRQKVLDRMRQDGLDPGKLKVTFTQY